MAYCVNCGERLQDGVKFCAGCGAFVEHQQSENSKRKAVYDGELHKCPNCGETLNSFVVNCPSCGYELRGAKSANAVQELAHKLDLIESQREYGKPVGVFKKQPQEPQISKTDERKINMIKSFAIPNTKEDLFEFIILASSNINLERYDEQGELSESQKAVSDAWLSKLEQAYEKARVSFGYAKEFAKMEELYKKRNAQIENAKKRKKKSYIKSEIMGGIGFFCFFWF